MRVLPVLLSLIFFLSACAKEVTLVTDTASSEPLAVEGTDVIELRLSPEEIARYADKDAEIWAKAREAGLIKVFNKIVNRNLIMVPADGIIPLGAMAGEYGQYGTLTDVTDEETGDMVQKFSVSAGFTADMDLSGRIVVLEEDAYIAGMHDVAYAMLHRAIPQQTPAYAVIAEPAKELSSHVLRLIGLAEIKQITPHTVALPGTQQQVAGTLCTLEIMASDREIEADDRVFLLDVEVAALDPEARQAIAADPETVIVQPRHVDTIEEPKEQK